MKKIILIIIIIAVNFASCENDDLLNKYPKTTLSPQTFWKTEADVLAGINGCYSGLQSWTWLTRDYWSDLLVHTEQQSNYKIQGVVTGTWGGGDGAWSSRYNAITRTNYFLENVATITGMNLSFINRTKAEARFIRAFNYMLLVMDFGDVPLVKKVLTIEEARTITRDPASEVWSFIEAELNDILDYLPVEYPSAERGRITRGAALSLLAKSMLYSKQYQKAYTAAKSVIDLGVYSLYPSFEDLFGYSAEGNSEVILDIQYDESLRSYDIFSQYAPIEMNLGVTCNLCLTKDLADAFRMQTTGLDINEPGSGWNPMDPYKDRDPRMKGTMLIPYFSDATDCFIMWNTGKKLNPAPLSGTPDEIGVGTYRNITGYFLKKYINKEDLLYRTQCGTDFILTRYAEVLLIAAEALIEQNSNLPIARGYINEVRARANMPLIPETVNSQTELRSELRHERLVELACEGWRYYDIIRWGIGEEVVTGVIKGISYLKADGTIETVSTSMVRNWDNSKDNLLPIPVNERIKNPNLTQNPGYIN